MQQYELELKDIRIERGIDEEGHNFKRLHVHNDRWMDAWYIVSRKLTATSSESHDGVFTCNKDGVEEKFHFGDQYHVIRLPGLSLNRAEQNAQEFRQSLEERVQLVRQWVESIPWYEVITFAPVPVETVNNGKQIKRRIKT